MIAFVSRKNGYGKYELGTSNNTVVRGKSVDSIRSKARKYIGLGSGKAEVFYSEENKYGTPDLTINF